MEEPGFCTTSRGSPLARIMYRVHVHFNCNYCVVYTRNNMCATNVKVFPDCRDPPQVSCT